MIYLLRNSLLAFLLLLLGTKSLYSQWYLKPDKVKLKNVKRICLQDTGNENQIDSIIYYDNGTIKQYIVMYLYDSKNINQGWHQVEYNYTAAGLINQVIYSEVGITDFKTCRDTTSLQQFSYRNGLLESFTLYDFGLKSNKLHITEDQYTDTICTINYEADTLIKSCFCCHNIPVNIVQVSKTIFTIIHIDTLGDKYYRVIQEKIYSRESCNTPTIRIFYLSIKNNTIQSQSNYYLSEKTDTTAWEYAGNKYKLKDSLTYSHKYIVSRKVHRIAYQSSISSNRKKYKTKWSQKEFLTEIYCKWDYVPDLFSRLNKYKKVIYIEYK